VGQPEPSNCVVWRVRPLHGESGQRGGVCRQRRDANRQLRNRRPRPSQGSRLGHHAAAVKSAQGRCCTVRLRRYTNFLQCAIN